MGDYSIGLGHQSFDQAGSFKPSNQSRQANKRRDGQKQQNQARLTPFSITYEKLLLIIRDLFDFRWPKPIMIDLAK